MADLNGKSFGRYRIIERLGEGGMASVYKAYDFMLEREVAIKIIRREAFPPEILHDVLKRFEREAKSLGRLSHPNIVKVLDFGEHEGSPFLVLEYLSGGTLKQQVGTAIPWQEAVHLLLPIARGVEYAHQRGVIHRDIKPANILMTEGGEPTLSDFGIAKIFGGEKTTNLTGSGMAIGTPEYMAPEQWTGITSIQSDVYALGVVLYELITGRKPYVADTPGGILVKQIVEPLPLPREFAPDLPEAAEAVLLKALAKEPKDRYADMRTLIVALENLLLNSLTQPITAISTVQTQPEPSLPIKLQDSGDTVLPTGMPETVMPPIRITSEAVERKPTALPKFSRKGIFAGLGALIIVVAAIAGYPSLQKMFTAVPIPTATSTATNTFTPPPSPSLTATELPPSATVEPSLTPTGTITPIATTLPVEIFDAKGVTMRLVPAGDFIMGSSGGREDEKPIHTVYLDAFYMDVYEVTNTVYKACVVAKVCPEPEFDTGNTYHRPGFEDHPITITWDEAQQYCQWRGGRLPTEAEWEKAARGTDGRTYPWGKTADESYANYGRAIFQTVPVGNYPKGKSPYGMYDMAGNAWEWVADWYAKDYYAISPASNPTGPAEGTQRVVRGGAWGYEASSMRTSAREAGTLSVWWTRGVRCAVSSVMTDVQPEVTATNTIAPIPSSSSTLIAQTTPIDNQSILGDWTIFESGSAWNPAYCGSSDKIFSITIFENGTVQRHGDNPTLGTWTIVDQQIEMIFSSLKYSGNIEDASIKQGIRHSYRSSASGGNLWFIDGCWDGARKK